MKNILILLMYLLLILFSIGCTTETPKAYTVHLQRTVDNNIQSSHISCDSVNMIAFNTADVWIDGHKMRVYSRCDILISTNK